MKALPLFLLLLAPGLRAADGDPVLTFVSGDKEVLKLTAADMAKRPSARVVTVDDPFYKATKRFKAVPLKDLLTAAYGGAWGENALGEAFFDALDGYRAHARVSVLMNDGAMVAFADADAKDGAFPVMPGKTFEPGPFYVVWVGAKQQPKAGFPWPWQLASVKMTVLEDEYPAALPKNAGPGTAPVRGWAVFKRSCISCHAISGAGGAVGPDLNEPRGITRYHSKSHLKAYIKKASSFRHTKMPDFDELEPSELNDLMAYFDHMSELHGTK